MKRRLLSVLITICAIVLHSPAQTIVLSESFESGLPAGWTQENVAGNQLWTTESGGDLQYPAGVVAGKGRAALRNTTGESQGYKTRLITPEMRLDTVFQPVLRYFHAQPKWATDFDTLRVWFRTSPTSDWVLLQEFAHPVASWTKEYVELPRPTATYRLCFEGSENMGRGIVLDSILVRSKPECTIPHDMMVSNMTEDAVTLMWQASYDAVNFRIVLAKSDAAFDIDTVDIEAAKASGLITLDTIVPNLPFYARLNRLEPKTNYVAFVRSLCETENSDWGVYSFYKKAITSVPYYENFDMPASSEPGHLADWTYGNSLMNDNPFICRHLSEANTKLYVRGGTSLCFTGNSSVGSGANIAGGEYVYAATPEMAVSSLQDYQVRFWGSLGAYGCYRTMARAIIIGVMEDPEDFATFVPVDTMTLWKYADFEEHTTSLASYTGEGKYIAFASRFDNPNQFYIEDLNIEAIPAVGKVSRVRTFPGVTGVDLSWQNTGTQNYSVVISKVNTAQVDTLKAAERIVDASVSATAYSATGLEEATSYFAYVKGEGGEWSNAAAFTTSFAKTLPMDFGFEKTENVTWQWFTTAAKDPTITTSSAYKHTGAQALSFSMEPGRDAWLVFPRLDTAAQGVEIDFWMRAYGTSYKNTQVTVGVMDDPADLTSFEAIASFANATTTYTQYYTDFLPYTGTGRYIAIRWTEATGSGNSYPILDDISIRRLSECIMPRVDVTDITTENATLTWEARNMTKFHILIDSVNTRTNAALGTAFTGKNAPYTATVENTQTFTIPAGTLRWGRTYYAYVRSVSSDGSQLSVWSAPVEFTLGVPAAIPLPYTETFDYWGTGTGAMAAGWDVVSTGAYPQVSTSAKYKGYAGVYLKSDVVGRAGKLYVPVLDTDDLSKVKISFYGKKGDNTGGADSLLIGVAAAADTLATITWLNSIAVAERNFIKYETVLSGWQPAMGNRIVFCVAQNNTSRYVYLDDITFESMQNITPFGFETLSVEDGAATIQWQGEAENGWDIVVTTEEVNPADLSKVDADKIVIKDSVITLNPFTINDLTPQTGYFAYLRPVGSTTWSEGHGFFTACQKLSTAAYYKMDFEGYLPEDKAISSYATSTFPQCWTRHTADENVTDRIPFIRTVSNTFQSPQDYAYTGLAAARIYGSATSAPSWFTTPEIAAQNMANVTVSFWVRCKKSGAPFGMLHVGVMKNPDDWSTFTPLYTYYPTDNKTWVQIDCNLGTYGYKSDMGNYITFATPADGTESHFCIDDIELYESACRKPYPVLSRLTASSVRLAYANEALDMRMLLMEEKEVSADALNDANNTDYLPTLLSDKALRIDTLITGRMGILLDTLHSDATYYVALQTQCTEDELSQWVVTSFHTLCAPQTVGDMGLIDFEDMTGNTSATPQGITPISCWTTGNKGSALDPLYIPYIANDKASPAGKNFLRFRTNAKTSNGAYAIMPAIDVDSITRLQMSFLGRAMNSYQFTTTYTPITTAAGGIIVGVVTDPTDLSTFVGVDTLFVSDNNTYDMLVRFNNYKGDANENYGKHIAFLAEFNKDDYFFVDNIRIDTIPDCATPLSLKVDSLSDTSASVSWNGLNDAYRVMVTTEEVPASVWETYSGYLLNDTVHTASYRAEGLTGTTLYYVYVKALCSDTDGEWCMQGISLTTDCPAMLTLPYKEDFDRYTSATMKNPPACWQTFYNGLTNTDASYPSVNSNAKNGTSGNGLSWTCSTTYAAENKRPTAVTLPVRGNISETTISFDYKCSVATAPTPSAILLGLATDASCLDSLMATVQYIDTIYPPARSSAWQEYSRIMDDCTGENMHIVLSEYYVTSTGNTLYLDNFKVEKTPTCYAPEDAAIDSIGATEVKLHITPHFLTDTRWDIMAVSADHKDTVVQSTTDTVCLLTGLHHSTAYTLRVRTDCGDGDVSAWIETPLTFTTLYKIGDGAFYGFEEDEALNSSLYIYNASSSIGGTYVPQPTEKVSHTGKRSMLLQVYNQFWVNSYFALPEIMGADTLQLRFEMRATDLGLNAAIVDKNTWSFAPLEIGTINTDYDLSSYQPIATYRSSMYEPNNDKRRACDIIKDSNNRMFDEVVVPLPTDMEGKFLVFLNPTAVSNNIYIDNLRLEKKQGWQTPVISGSTVTPTSLTLNWDANGATAWNVYLLNTPQAFPLDSADASDIVAQQLNVTATTATFTGLQPETKYYAYLQIAGAAGLGATSARRIYLTPAETRIPTDSVLTFEGVHTTKVDIDLVGRYPSLATGDSIYALPMGWYAGNAVSSTRPTQPWARLNGYDATGTTVSAGITVAHRGERALQLNTPGNSTTIGAYAAMPELDADYDTLQVNFYARPFYLKADGTISSTGSLNTPLVVGTMTDPNNPATFEALDTLYYGNPSLPSGTDASKLENSGFWKFGFRLSGAKGRYVAFSAPRQSQWYIDNISFGPHTCLTPNAVQVSDITAHTALLRWKPKDTGASCILQVATASDFTTSSIVLTDTLTATSRVVERLAGTTTYYCRVRQICSAAELSDWSPVADFFTECADMDDTYFNGFENTADHIYLPGATSDSYLQPRCWTVGNTCQGGGSSYFRDPCLVKSSGTGNYASWASHNTTADLSSIYSWEMKGKWTTAEVTSSNASNYYDEWMAMPAWDDTISTDSLQLSFYALAGKYNPTKELISSVYTSASYLPSVIVGVMSDPNDLSTFVPLDTCTYTESITTSTVANAANDYMFLRFSVSLKGMKDAGRYIAFRTYTQDYIATHPEYTSSTITTQLYIDDISVEPLNECHAPTQLTASDITLSSATLSWTGDEDASYVLNVSTDPTFADATAAVVTNDTLTEMTATINQLDTFTTYYWTVRQLCSAVSKSPASAVASFHTLRTPAYTEYFVESNTQDWLTASAKAEDVFAGTELQTGVSSTYWTHTANANNYGINGPHMLTRMNSSYGETGTAVRRTNWLLSPAVVLDDTHDAWLTFNAALTYYDNGNEADQTGWDDQFMVIISEDGGKTWSRANATVWNNETSTDTEDARYLYGPGDYVLNDLPAFSASDDPVFIDLSQYKGKTVKVAFYAESTVKNAYNGLHIGNVHINYYTKQEDAQTACRFEDIESMGIFTINGDEATAGEHVYTKVVLGADNTGEMDKLYRLRATYEEAPQVVISHTICEGEAAGAEWGFENRTVSGVYKRKGVSAVTGCDSITTLNLTVLPRLYSEEEVAICSGTSYDFNGTICTKTGVYVDTLQSLVTGCDSIVTLILTVTPAITYEYEAHTCVGTSYYFTPRYPALTHSGRYIDSLTTEEGCDSIVTLNLIVSDTINIPVYQNICEGETFLFEGTEYKEPGTYPVYLQSVNGCDSVRTLYLTVGEVYADTITATICPGQVYNEYGFEVSEPGTHFLKNLTALGCDSITWLELSLAETDTIRIDTTINAADLPYFYPGTSVTYPIGTAAGVYTDTVLVQAGNGGCDYLLIHRLEIRGTESIGNLTGASLQLRPTLLNRNEKVYIDNRFTPAEKATLRIEVYDMVGHTVDIHVDMQETICLSNFPAAGIYSVRITTESGIYIGRVVVKN